MSESSEFELISRVMKTRRSIRTFTAEPVGDADIEALLESATWAPNHRMTEPWRFFVLRNGSAKRAEVAKLVHDWTISNTPNQNRASVAAEEVREEVLSSPALIYVYSLPGTNDEMTEENYSATSCAVQNLMLAAHAKGLGTGWSTGKVCKPSELASVLGADDSWKMVGCLFMGHPAESPSSVRAPVADVTRWL